MPKTFSDMRSLVDYLNKTAHEYYVLDNPSISDAEWDKLYERFIQIEEQKRFYMIRDIIKVLEEREAHPDRYPTMRDFMPRYIETINAYEK